MFLETRKDKTYRIIGDDYQRLFIEFTEVKKDAKVANAYLVTGKTTVKKVVCDFSEKITIKKVQTIVGNNFGIDDEWKDEGIKSQGIIEADYEFFEDKNQLHSGVLTGQMQAIFLINEYNKAEVNDINYFADSFFNNAYVGKWKNMMLQKKKSAIGEITEF